MSVPKQMIHFRGKSRLFDWGWGGYISGLVAGQTFGVQFPEKGKLFFFKGIQLWFSQFGNTCIWEGLELADNYSSEYKIACVKQNDNCDFLYIIILRCWIQRKKNKSRKLMK
jgi:hypothetical protein